MKVENIHVVAIHGKQGAGKNFLASKIKKWVEQGELDDLITPLLPKLVAAKIATPCNTATILPLATQLKAHCVAIGNPIEQVLAEEKTKETRDLLIWTADSFRSGNDLYYCKAWVTQAKIHQQENGVNFFIIPDLRESVERMFLCRTFPHLTLISVQAPERTLQRLHLEANGDNEWAEKQAKQKSETGLDLETNEENAATYGFTIIHNN